MHGKTGILSVSQPRCQDVDTEEQEAHAFGSISFRYFRVHSIGGVKKAS